MHIADPQKFPADLFLCTLRPLRLEMQMLMGAWPEEAATMGSGGVSYD